MTDSEAPRAEKKFISLFLFVVGGGIVGFAFHLAWHFWLDIDLFVFASHIVIGAISTAIGMVLGLLAWYLFSRKS